MTSIRCARATGLSLIGLLLAVLVGCGQNTEQPIEPHGRHGGHSIKMPNGVGYQMEFTLDGRRRRMVIYVEESGAHKPYPLALDQLEAEFEADGQSTGVTFPADPRSSDPEGHASRFSLSLDKLPQQLLASERYVLKISHSIAGENVTVSFSHDNDHGHEYHHD